MKKTAAPVKVGRPVAAKVAAAAVTNLDALPAILTLEEISGIYRLAIPTIRRALQTGTFRPKYWDKYPYRWRREDVLADLKKPREEKRRAHGFASVRRQARASIDKKTATAAR